MSYGEKVIDFVREVVKEYGPRLAGSEAELRAGELIYKLMSEFCDEVRKDWFVSRPRGFTDYIGRVLPLPPWRNVVLHGALVRHICPHSPRIVDICSPTVLAL